MEALRAHFSGEGNPTRINVEVEGLQSPLNHKNKRSMTFEVFLTMCQKMYTIFEDENEPMDDKEEVRFLFKAVEGPGLSASIEALKARMSTSVTPVTYTTITNHLAITVSELTDNVTERRNVSGFSADGSPNVYYMDGTIDTGHKVG